MPDGLLSTREKILLLWGQLHIGEIIRRGALRQALRTIPNFSPQQKGAILDAGCGRGDNALMLAKLYPHSTIDAVDIDPSLTALLTRRVANQKQSNCQVITADLAEFTTATRYQLIYCIDVLEHIENPAPILSNFAKLLTPEGTLLIHVPRAKQQRYFKRFEHYEQHDHARAGYEPQELRTFLQDAGLQVTSLQHTFGPPGALAWELYHLAHSMGKLSVLLLYPVLFLLAHIDLAWKWKRGNGILISACHV